MEIVRVDVVEQAIDQNLALAKSEAAQLEPLFEDADLQRIFARQLPYVPLLVPNDVWAWSTDVTGFDPSPVILYPYYSSVEVAR